MAKLKIVDLWSDVDYTLTTFGADGGYRAAAGIIADRVIQPTQDIHRVLMAQYDNIHANGMTADGKWTVREELRDTFRRRTMFSKSVPEEAFWSRFAAFMQALRYFGTGLYDVHECRINAAHAEAAFWTHIEATGRPYDDVLALIVAAGNADARIHPITSSDVRITHKGKLVTYNPDASTALKLARVERALGRFLPRPVVFEEYRKASREGWEKYVLPNFPDVDMSRSAIVGDCPGDVEAGAVMGMPVRILLDRDGVYWDKPLPEAATHVARSLDVIPAILGWV